MGPIDDIREPLPAGAVTAAEAAWASLGEPGRWWAGEERLAIAEVARDARPSGGLPPDLSASAAVEPPAVVSPLVVALATRVAIAPATLTRSLVGQVADRIGDAAYAELCAVVAQVVAVDQLRAALGYDPAPFPRPTGGEPNRTRPEGMTDVGGHIQMRSESFGPNVARSLSLAGEDGDRWLGLVLTMYAGADFDEMVWPDHPLGRPGVELLAARTSALNECFY